MARLDQDPTVPSAPMSPRPPSGPRQGLQRGGSGLAPVRRPATWFRWSMLLRPFRSRRDGTMPAGLILVIVVLGLLLAGVLNADATLRKSNAKGDGWRNEVAHLVAGVADTFRITALRGGIDDAIGRNQQSDVDVADLVAQQQQVDPSQAEAEAEQARLAALEPKLPPATPEAPLKLWVGGDSISQNFGQALIRIAEDTKVLTPTLDYKVATGLARPDYFNWPEHLAKDVLPKNPSIVVIMFGANDGQNMTVDGKALSRYSDEWLTEYRRRVGLTMDLMRSPANDRIVIWVGAPIMGPNSGVTGMDKLNYIFWDEARTRPWVKYFDTWPYLADTELQYTAQAPNADGKVRTLRAKDNVHMSLEGGTRVGWGVIDMLGDYVNLTAGNIVPPPSEIAPPEVQPRKELPVPS